MNDPRDTHPNPRLNFTELPQQLFANSEGWLGTPPAHRTRRAWELLTETAQAASPGDSDASPPEDMLPQEAEDLEWLVRSITADQYGREHLSRMADHNPPANDNEALRRITEMAHLADTEHTIGVILEMSNPGDRNPLSHLVLAQLVRHPDWIGTSPMLPLVKDLHATITESKTNPGLPGVVLVNNHPDPDQTHRSQDVPPGDPAHLAAVLRWHGAASCNWTSWQQIEDSLLPPR